MIDFIKATDSLNEGRKKLNAIAKEMNDKDVSSAPEIIEARDGEPSLKARLDKEKNEVASQLAQTTGNLNLLEDDVLNRSKIINNNLSSEFVRLGNLQSFKDGIAKKYCRIAFVGDSITAGGNPVETSDRWVEQWQGIFRKKFPGVVFQFQNFGIGGRTLEDFSSPDFKNPTNFTAPWANQSGIAWRKYVQDYKPDLIILAFGMNPNPNRTPSYSMEVIRSFFDVMNKPSFLVLSSLVPQKEWANDWEKRVEYSRAVKNYSINNNFSFMDIYNKYRVLVDGVDESQRIAKLYKNGEGTISEGDLSKTKFSALNCVFIQTVQLNSTNQYKINMRETINILVSANALKIGSETVELPNLAGEKRITISFTTHLVVTIDGTIYYNKPYYSSFKEAPITFGWESGSGVTAGLSIINFDFADVVGNYTQDDIFGKYVEGDISTKEPTGGNGVNHPSSIGYNQIYVPLLYEFIQYFKDDFNNSILLPKTYNFDLSNGGAIDYYNVPNEDKIPFLVGILERTNGQAMTQRRDVNFTDNVDVGVLADNDFILRRTAGFVQIATKPQTVKTGFKFTTNVIS